MEWCAAVSLLLLKNNIPQTSNVKKEFVDFKIALGFDDYERIP